MGSTPSGAVPGWTALALAVLALVLAACASPAALKPDRSTPIRAVTGATVETHPAVLSTARTSRTARVRSAGGPRAWVAPKGWTITGYGLAIDGLHRSYLVARPVDPGVAHLPVLVVLHGREMTPRDMAAASGFLGLVGPAVVVYPAGMARSWNAGYCCGAAHAMGVDDVAFLEKVVAAVVGGVPGASAPRVYLVGYSNGGRMAYRMACTDPGAFAAVAAVEAVPVAPCGHVPAVPVAVVASTGDPLLTVPAGGSPKYIAGRAEPTVSAVVSQWRSIDGCAPAGSQERLGAVTLSEWSRCSGAARVEFAEYVGGSHHWPGGGPGTPSAESVIWSFFSAVGSTRPPAAR